MFYLMAVFNVEDGFLYLTLSLITGHEEALVKREHTLGCVAVVASGSLICKSPYLDDCGSSSAVFPRLFIFYMCGFNESEVEILQ